MDTPKSIKTAQKTMLVTFIIGLALLITGIVLEFFNINIVENTRGLIGLSFIPLAMALFSYIRIDRIKKSPDNIRYLLLYVDDERIQALKNDANARAFKLVHYALFLCYMGYTLIVPADIFEAIGWWILTFLLVLSFGAQSVLLSIALKNEATTEEE